MKVIVFDLDDTLYEEETFVKSGYRAVAHFLSEHPAVADSAAAIYGRMLALYAVRGRDGLFDRLLRERHMLTKTLLRKCLSVYRLHDPQIRLPETTLACLLRLKHYPLYVVTDGNKIVQHNKLKALGLCELMKHCYVTHRYGVRHAKPSPYCFLDIAAREKVVPSEVVYVGDNPRKDFVGIKPLGFRTVRVRTGAHHDLSLDQAHEADIAIASLDELAQVLDQWK